MTCEPFGSVPTLPLVTTLPPVCTLPPVVVVVAVGTGSAFGGAGVGDGAAALPPPPPGDRPRFADRLLSSAGTGATGTGAGTGTGTTGAADPEPASNTSGVADPNPDPLALPDACATCVSAAGSLSFFAPSTSPVATPPTTSTTPAATYSGARRFGRSGVGSVFAARDIRAGVIGRPGREPFCCGVGAAPGVNTTCGKGDHADCGSAPAALASASIISAAV